MSCALAFVTACGGGYGDKALGELTSDELVQLCEDLTDIIGSPRTVTCDDVEVEIEPPDCTDAADETPPPGCTITVDEYLACARAMANDPCAGVSSEVPAACVPVFSNRSCFE